MYPILMITYLILMVAITSEASADSIFNFGTNNTVSSGRIIINGKEMGESSGNYVKGSGKKTTENRKTADFQRINIAGSLDLVYSAGKNALAITGDDNVISIIKTEINNGVLHIFSDKSFSTSMPITVSVSSPGLEAVMVEGSSDVSLQGLRSRSFLIQLNGTGEIIATGKVKSLDIDIFGTGGVNAKALSADNVDAKLNGTGDLQLTALQSLNATIVGTGDIVYFGNPQVVNRSSLGVGDIKSGD